MTDYDELSKRWAAGMRAAEPYMYVPMRADRGTIASASSRDLNVTARSLAPFPLREPEANRT